MAQTTNTGSAFTVYETLPEFPGGQAAFSEYLDKSFNYPASATKVKYQGTVIVIFIIGRDGRASIDTLDFEKISYNKNDADETLKLKAKEDITSELNKLFENMPLWTPCYQNGKPAQVKYKLPYHFQ